MHAPVHDPECTESSNFDHKTIKRMTSNNAISRPMGLQKLLQEPRHLEEEIQKINGDLESLIIENYKVFVENLTCSMQLQSEEEKLNQISAKLEANVETLQSTCSSFRDRVSMYVQFHKRNRKTLQSHLQLLELLEVPQLIEACTRNGFYDEALELAHFVHGLERRQLLASEVKQSDAQGTGVIRSIVSEIDVILEQLMQQLLLQLTEVTALPKQIQIIGILRKIDALTIDRFLALQRFSDVSASVSKEEREEAEGNREVVRSYYLEQREIKHQMDFLEAKTVWIQKQLSEVQITSYNAAATTITTTTSASSTSSTGPSMGRLGPYGRAMEMLEIRRTSLHTVISQFRSLFCDSSSITTSTTSSNTASFVPIASNKILTSWTSVQVQQLLSELKDLLIQIDEGASVRAIFEQCLYVTSRLATVGCDFSAVVIELFEEVVMTRLRQELDVTLSQWRNILTHEKISFDVSTRTAMTGNLIPESASDVAHVLREQVIPLYNSQDLHPAITASTTPSATTSITSTASTSSLSGGMTRSMVDDVAPPLSLLRFPPLAFFLNNCLILLNFLREFPLLTIVEDVLQLFNEYMLKLVTSLIEQSSELREKGSKFFGEGFMSNLGGAAKKTSSTSALPEKLDLLYAEALAVDVIPYLFMCLLLSFQQISFSTVKAYVHKNQLHEQQSSQKHWMTDVRQSKELFGLHVTNRIEEFWKMLIQAKLLDDSSVQLQRHIIPLAIPPSLLTTTTTTTSSSSAPPNPTTSTNDIPSSNNDVTSDIIADKDKDEESEGKEVSESVEKKQNEVVEEEEGEKEGR